MLHHSDGRDATVFVAVTPTDVRLIVRDPGPRRPWSLRSSVGHGLGNMRVRAESCGGTLEAGPEGAGWAVHATLPRAAAAEARAEGDEQRPVEVTP